MVVQKKSIVCECTDFLPVETQAMALREKLHKKSVRLCPHRRIPLLFKMQKPQMISIVELPQQFLLGRSHIRGEVRVVRHAPPLGQEYPDV